MRTLIEWFYVNRYALKAVWKRDLKNLYAGTHMGFIWVIFNPILYAVTLYVVFEYGLHIASKDGISHGIYILTGLVPWMLVSAYLSSSAGMLSSYSYLIKRSNISTFVIPIVRLKTEVLIHLSLILVISIFIGLDSLDFSKWYLLIYYFLSLCVFLFGCGLIVASISLFFTDVKKMIGLIVQTGFWLTPIVWSLEVIPEKYLWLVELNPFEYLVSGYRCALISYCKGKEGFYWQDMYFGILALMTLMLGLYFFSRLKPYFSEVV